MREMFCNLAKGGLQVSVEISAMRMPQTMRPIRKPKPGQPPEHVKSPVHRGIRPRIPLTPLRHVENEFLRARKREPSTKGPVDRPAPPEEERREDDEESAPEEVSDLREVLRVTHPLDVHRRAHQ